MKKRVTVKTLQKMKQSGEKIATLTAYDASHAAVLDENGTDVILIGDSLGMVIQGYDSTVPVSVSDMIYHSRAVAKSCNRALVMTDLPFMSYTSPDQALKNAAKLMQQGHAQMVKLEGGAPQVETVKQLVHHGVPVCAHLGLQPQSVNKLGGYFVQGRDQETAQQMKQDAQALQDAGADALLLECVPVELARNITAALEIPTIGIGAGSVCDGQVLVLQDMLGITKQPPSFSQDFLSGQEKGVAGAVADYVTAVKRGTFPSAEHTFQ